MTDGRFLSAIRGASQNDTAYFTRNQLYATYCRRRKHPWIPQIIISAFIFFLVIFILATNGLLFLAIIVSLFAFVFLLSAFAKPNLPTPEQFMSAIEYWIRDDKPIEKLIRQPSLHQPPPPSDEPDLYDYGVQRILFVQRDELVDLMVLNGMHAAESMLVLSVSGYPNYLLPKAVDLLNQQPDLPIHLLHDADTTEHQMRQSLEKLNLPLGDRKVIDLGFSPGDFARMKRMRQVAPKNRERDLPVDMLATPLLATGIAACFAGETTMAALLDEYAHEQAVANSAASFG